MKYFIGAVVFCLLQFLSFSALAEIAITTEGTNASNVYSPDGTGPAFYYSNITDKTDGTNWLPGSGAAGSCTAGSFLINPNCRDATQNFNFTARASHPTSGLGAMYVVYIPAGTPVPDGSKLTPIAAIGTQVFQFGYSPNKVAGPANIHFGDVCTVLSSVGLPISSNCVQADPTTPLIASLYVIADSNGDGYFGPGEDILPFTFTVQSSIPVNSSVKEQTGLYGFRFEAGDNVLYLWPEVGEGTGVMAASYIKFYYLSGPDVHSSFDVRAFQKINAPLTPPAANIPSKKLLLRDEGTFSPNYIDNLKNGTSYYIRAAIVDAAGNTGYLTPEADDSAQHAAKPESPK